MDTSDAPRVDDTSATPAPRRFTVDEYHRLIDQGIIHEDESVQLIEGIIVQTAPQKPSHAKVLETLTRAVVKSLAGRYRVRPQLPLTFIDSEPEPDLAVAPALESREPNEKHPRTALLVVEVAEGSLAYDRSVKARIYARAGIPEYWIVNLADASVEISRDPQPGAGRYRTGLTVKAGETLTASTVPELTLPVATILG
jgi:Uma2 family endonuclease